MLKEKIINKATGILTYGITPPKRHTSPEKIEVLSHKHMERISQLDIDGLILYDVQNEIDRVEEERPFPYLPTIDPYLYSEEYLHKLRIPKIIYRCAVNDTERELSEWISSDLQNDRFSVLVGASSGKQKVNMTLTQAYELSMKLNKRLILGGVVIPERHMKKGDEHLRIVRKMNSGCTFFVSQATYNIESTKNMLSDYYYYCTSNNIEMVPILINLAPCGSQKTLEFMKWLGISIPKWLENELLHSNDILDKSINLSKEIFKELFEFGLEKNIPVGCSIESVSTRKVEIEASIHLVKEIKSFIDRRI